MPRYARPKGLFPSSRGAIADTAGATMAATRDYIGATKERFRAAWDALMYHGDKNWPTSDEDAVILREFIRQWNDWQTWYQAWGETALGWMRGYDKVQAFDLNLSRVLRRAKAAGANIQSVPMGRADDPQYKGEVNEANEPNPLGQVVSILKWGTIGYLAIQIVGAIRK